MWVFCGILGSCSGVNEMPALLEYYAGYISSYRSFGATYRFRLQRSNNPRKHRRGVQVYQSSFFFFCISWTAWPLKMGPLGYPEMSVTTNLHYVTNVPEKRRSQRNILYYQPFDCLGSVGRSQCPNFCNHCSHSTPCSMNISPLSF